MVSRISLAQSKKCFRDANWFRSSLAWTIFAVEMSLLCAPLLQVSHIWIERFQQRISRAIDRFYFFSVCRALASCTVDGTTNISISQFSHQAHRITVILFDSWISLMCSPVLMISIWWMLGNTKIHTNIKSVISFFAFSICPSFHSAIFKVFVSVRVFFHRLIWIDRIQSMVLFNVSRW